MASFVDNFECKERVGEEKEKEGSWKKDHE